MDTLQDNPYWPSAYEKYAQLRAKGMSMKQAALDAGFKPSQAINPSERVKPVHNMLLKEALPAIGATNIFVAQRIKDALEAKRVIYCDGDMQETEIADHKIRMDAAKLIAQVTGQLDTKATVALQIVLPNVAQDDKAWGDALIIAQPEEQ